MPALYESGQIDSKEKELHASYYSMVFVASRMPTIKAGIENVVDNSIEELVYMCCQNINTGSTPLELAPHLFAPEWRSLYANKIVQSYISRW